MIKLKEILNEMTDKVDDIILRIKRELIWDGLAIVDDEEFSERFGGDWGKAWKKFVDDQELGECQGICGFIESLDIDGVSHCFGEVEIDNEYEDEYGDVQSYMTHHWVTIFGKIYEFSKGTLRHYVDWDDEYSVSTDDWRYDPKWCR